MNDEFLHALRRDPPPEFARELQRRLRRKSARRSPWWTLVLTMLLIGGVAMAAALLLRNRGEPLRADSPVAQQAAPRASVRATQSTTTVQPDQQPPSATSSPSPAATEDDVPVALAASSLVRPLAEALAETVSKYYSGVARARLTTMDDDESLNSLCGNLDFVMASRRITDAERDLCQRWGSEVVEWQLGYQAVALAAAPTTELPPLAPREVFLALARRIPDPVEPARLIENPNATWRDVDARFDSRSIDVLMPPDATTRATFLQLVMEPGCETFPWIRSLKALDRARYDDICHQLRGDGRLREVALSNTLVTQQLWAQPNWLIVLDYSYYATYRRELSTMLQGPAPTPATLTDGTYPAARPVYVYGQKAHLYWPAGARAFSFELASPYTVGPLGSLARRGLVPLDDLERSKQR
jgi:phosphate transport system substrate-binding protein